MKPILKKISRSYLSLLFLFLISYSLFPFVTSAAAPTSGLIGYWNFDQGSGTTATDSSGSGNNGTLTNGPTWTTGKVGSGAISFDGTNDNVSLGRMSSTESASQLTWSFWAYANAIQNDDAFISKENVYNSGSWHIGMTTACDSGNQLIVHIAASAGDGGQFGCADPGSIATGRWIHYAVVFNGTLTGNANRLKIYVDGVQDSSLDFVGTIPAATIVSSDIAKIGSDPASVSNINAKIDEVRIYNRALSSQEVLDIYNDTGAPLPPDTTAPSTPTNLSATTVSSSAINVSWTASTDAVGVTGYKIFRNGTQIGTSASASYSDTGLSASTLYSYTVSAYDAASNNSSQSTGASATTQAPPPADTTPPIISSITSSSITQTGATIAWTTNENSDTQVEYGLTTSYGQSTTLNASLVTSHSATLSSLSAGSVYHFRVKSKDASSNLTTSADQTFTTSTPPPADTTAPSVPTNLSASAVSSSGINLTWTASTDAVGVTGYKIFRNGTQINTSATNSYSDSGLSASTNYSYTVSSYDAVGNNSAQTSSASATTQAPPVQGALLNSTRVADWTLTGAGAIPARTTICTTLNPGATPAQINTAISNCPSGQTVKLNAGTYNLSSGIMMKSNVTLRGAGPDSTFLVFTGSIGCGYAGSICFGDGGYNDTDSPSNLANWTAGYSQGATTITIGANVTGSAKPVIGNLIYLDQLNDTAETGNVYNCARTPECTQAGVGGSGQAHGTNSNRGQFQIQTVTAISSGACPCTVTISPGLFMPNWRSNRTPQAWWTGMAPGSGMGLEDLSINQTNNQSQMGVVFFSAKDSWVKNIRSFTSTLSNSGANNLRHFRVFQSKGITIRDSYIFGRRDIDDYGVNCYYCSNLLVENTIFQRAGTPIVNEAGVGNVFAYNYTINNYWGSQTPQEWAQGSFYSHAVGDNYWLIEGNDGFGITLENYFGQANFITGFRNRLYGYEGSLINQTVPVFNYAFSRYNNYIGNILGTAGYHNKYESNPSNLSNCDRSIFALGLGQNCGPEVADNPFTVTTLMRWGNWDVVNNASRFVASEVPSGLSLYANAVPSSQALPASLYLSSRPSWWGTMPWPAIGPDINGGDVSGVGGHVYRIPARKCFEDVMGGSFSNTTPRTFNANTCYGTGTPPPSDTTAPTIPTNLSATAISTSAINLSWTASTDAVGVTGYRIYRNGTQVGTSATNSYSDSSLSPSTSYTYTVSAYDAVGNNSSQSSSSSATTQAVVVTPLKGDLNLDHIVNSLDFSLLNSRWNQNYAPYDLLVDGIINSLDFAYLSSNWLLTW